MLHIVFKRVIVHVTNPLAECMLLVHARRKVTKMHVLFVLRSNFRHALSLHVKKACDSRITSTINNNTHVQF